MSTTDKDTSSEDWYIDFYSTVHITNDAKDLNNTSAHQEGVRTGAGKFHSTHQGTAAVNGMTLSKVLLIAWFPKKLIKIGDITAAGETLTLSDGNDVLRYQGTEHRLTKDGKLWKFLVEQEAHTIYADTEWHKRYGHILYSFLAIIPEATVHLHSV